MRIIRLAPSPWPIRAGRTRGADAMVRLGPWRRGIAPSNVLVPTGSVSWLARGEVR